MTIDAIMVEITVLRILSQARHFGFICKNDVKNERRNQ
jgi:hypothetical protein